MSEVITDKLTGRATANDVTVTVGATATQSLEQGLAKAWVNFDGTGTIATRDSFNVSGLTDNGTGNYDVNHTNNMNDANYSYQLSTNTWTKYNVTYSTSNHRLQSANASFTSQDAGGMFTTVHGDLA